MALTRSRERLLGRLSVRKGRERECAFVVEGVRSAAEALEHGAGIRFAVVSPRLATLGGGRELRERLERAGVEVAEVDDQTLSGLADTETPQGVVLVCDEPRGGLGTVGEAGPGGALALLLDGVQDPGNAGTLIRGAAAFGVPVVVALEGTVDPYNPKAVRAAAGGLFRTRVVLERWTGVEAWLRERDALLLVAETGGRDVSEVRPEGPWALAVGNEGAGTREAVRAAADEVVSIPIRGDADSLNAAVAGSILLHALTRGGRRS